MRSRVRSSLAHARPFFFSLRSRASEDFTSFIDLCSAEANCDAGELAQAYRCRGAVHACHQEWSESVADLTTALKAAGRGASGEFGAAAAGLRGRAYTCLREWTRATADYDYALKRVPKGSDAAKAFEQMRLDANHVHLPMPLLSVDAQAAFRENPLANPAARR